MEVSVNDFAWVDENLACECATSDDTPSFNVSGWKVVREFYNGVKEV